MKTRMKRGDLAGIASLLQSSPYVETLVIDIISGHIESDAELEHSHQLLDNCV